MAQFSRAQVVEGIRNGVSYDRTDLRNLDFDGAKLEKAKFRRADLEGANLGRCTLKKADLTSANLRDAYLAGADLEGASLQKADLEGAVLEGANLENADLSRANLEGANLEKARLNGARMTSAQLEQAKLGGALLLGADLSSADLREAYLGGAKLLQAKLQYARMDKAVLEEADLTEAVLTEADLRHTRGERANFSRAILERAILDEASLPLACFIDADLRGSSLRNTMLKGAVLTGAKLAGVNANPEVFADVKAEWVDFSTKTTEVRITGPELLEYYTRLKSGTAPAAAATAMPSAAPMAPLASDPTRRFFGEGDVLRNASLEFGEKSVVEIQSRFENCTIVVRAGAQLLIGAHGVLEGCQITGAGDIEVHGKLIHRDGTPSIVGPKRLIVKKTGSIVGCVQQHADLTHFGLERGCNLDLKIMRAR